MEDQGGAGGVPLKDHDNDDGRSHGKSQTHGQGAAARRRAARARARAEDSREESAQTTRAADTDEASRLDRPVGTPEPGRPTRWKGPDG